MASLAQSSATLWPNDGVSAALLLATSLLGELALRNGLDFGPGTGEGLGVGRCCCGRGLGKETAPLEGMWRFSMSHSTASLAAYCLASFLREKMALRSPSGEGFSPIVTKQVKRFRLGLDSW